MKKSAFAGIASLLLVGLGWANDISGFVIGRWVAEHGSDTLWYNNDNTFKKVLLDNTLNTVVVTGTWSTVNSAIQIQNLKIVVNRNDGLKADLTSGVIGQNPNFAAALTPVRISTDSLWLSIANYQLKYLRK